MMIITMVSLAGLLLSGVAAYDLNQEKSMSVKLGDSVSILCTAQDDSYYISWYQQKPGKAPQFLLRNDKRADGLSDRFTYTDSDNKDYLNIKAVEAQDEAVYYCACVNCGSDGVNVFAQGTKLVISGQPSSPPSLLLLAPSGSSISEDDRSVVCVAQGFHPDGATISWSEDGTNVAASEIHTGASEQRGDGTFSQTSVLRLSKQRWNSGRAYTCHVSHSALSAPLSQSTSMNQCM